MYCALQNSCPAYCSNGSVSSISVVCVSTNSLSLFIVVWLVLVGKYLHLASVAPLQYTSRVLYQYTSVHVQCACVHCTRVLVIDDRSRALACDLPAFLAVHTATLQCRVLASWVVAVWHTRAIAVLWWPATTTTTTATMAGDLDWAFLWVVDTPMVLKVEG